MPIIFRPASVFPTPPQLFISASNANPSSMVTTESSEITITLAESLKYTGGGVHVYTNLSNTLKISIDPSFTHIQIDSNGIKIDLDYTIAETELVKKGLDTLIAPAKLSGGFYEKYIKYTNKI